MADPVTLTALAITAVGAATSAGAGVMQAKEASKAEKLRKRAMQLEEQRRRVEINREAIMAQSVALTNATAQGAEGGSGLQGGYGTIQGVQGRGILASRQDEAIAGKMFASNARYAGWGGVASVGQGLQGFGSMLTNNADYLNRKYFTN